jgi:hypothetical protein
MKVMPHEELEVCNYKQGHTKDKRHCAAKMLALSDADLGMYISVSV